MLEKELAISNVLNAPRKNRRGVGASCSVFLHYLHPAKLISYMYSKKDNCDALSGLIITPREVRRVTRREQLCIFMQHKYFEDHEFHCVQRWVRVNREGSEAHAFEDTEEKEEGGGVQSNLMPVRLLFIQRLKRI